MEPVDARGGDLVFLSYSRDDQEFAKGLRSWLLDQGHRPWMDSYDIPAGARWPDEIDRALRSANVILGILSPNALRSPNVKNEWDWAIENGRRLILARMKPCEVPFHYISLNYIDFTDGLEAGLEVLERSLKTVTEAGLRSQTRPSAAIDSALDIDAGTKPRTNLPSVLSSIIGRDEALDEVQALLGATRLLTIVGPGGVGKTRFALAMAHLLTPQFEHGIYFVPLTPLDRPELVATSIANSLGVQEVPGQSTVKTICAVFGDRSLLLVLDNFEHVISAASFVSDLLEACPHMTVIATSRIPLRVRGEQEFPLRPLSDEAARSLFIRRSREVKPDFNPDGDQESAIVEICQRLDRLPLAIELAASRIKLLPPAALLKRLEEPLKLLKGSRRDLPTHQQTLRDTIAWSYELLPPDDQSLFRTLSVFAGGWTLEAVEHIVPHEIDVFEGIDRLAESNLIETNATDSYEPRFRMLEMIREFALEQFEDHQEALPVRERHSRYFAELVATAMSHIYGPDQIAWLDRLEEEHSNLRAALDWLADNDVCTALEMVGPMWRFWWMRGYLDIGGYYYDMLLEKAENTTVDQVIVGHALTGAGIMAEWQLDHERAIQLQNRAISIWLELPNPPSESFWPFVSLGNIAAHRGEFERAESLYREGFRFSEENNLEYGTLMTRDSIGIAALYQGKFKLAEECYRKNIEIGRSIGEIWTVSEGLTNLGHLLLSLGKFDEARPVLEEAYELSVKQRHSRDASRSLSQLGIIDVEQGQIDQAELMFTQSMSLANEIADPEGICSAKLGLATVERMRGDLSGALRLLSEAFDAALSLGEPRGIVCVIGEFAATFAEQGGGKRAAQLVGFAAGYRDQNNMPASPRERKQIEETQMRILKVLRAQEFDRLWQKGFQMRLEQIVAELTKRTAT